MSQDAQQIRADVEPGEPAAGQAGVPIWLILLLGLLVYWGMVYLETMADGFNPEVFEPFQSYEQLSLSQPYIRREAMPRWGRPCLRNLAPCAIKRPGWARKASSRRWPVRTGCWRPGPNRIGRIVLNGLTGPIRVEAAGGVVGLNATMAPLGGDLQR